MCSSIMDCSTGQRYLFGLFKRPPRGWDSLRIINRAVGVVSIMLIILGGWTLALPLLWRRTPRLGWRRLLRQPGVAACVAALAGMAFATVIGGGVMVLRWWADGVTQLPNNWVRSSPLDATVVYAGTAVAAVWVSQAVAGCSAAHCGLD